MNIIAVDDEYAALCLLKEAIMEAVPDCSLACFDTSDDALNYARETRVDIAFLDVNMPGMNGLELGKALKDIYAKTNILFVTGYSQYAVDAFSMGGSGYIIKPPDAEEIIVELNRLRDPVEDESAPKLLQGIGAFKFEHTARQVLRDGKNLLLTHREYSIFHFLANNPNVYFSPQELYAKTAGQNANDELRTIYVHISRLRKKLELDDIDAKAGIDIEQQRGKGYRLIVQNK